MSERPCAGSTPEKVQNYMSITSPVLYALSGNKREAFKRCKKGEPGRRREGEYNNKESPAFFIECRDIQNPSPYHHYLLLPLVTLCMKMGVLPPAPVPPVPAQNNGLTSL